MAEFVKLWQDRSRKSRKKRQVMAGSSSYARQVMAGGTVYFITKKLSYFLGLYLQLSPTRNDGPKRRLFFPVIVSCTH